MQNRGCGIHSGLAIYLDDKFVNPTIEPHFSPSKLWECQSITINLPKSKIRILNMYRPRRFNDKNEIIDKFLDEITPILRKIPNSQQALLGCDLNLDLLQIDEKSRVSNFFETMLSHNFYPQITRPTRFSDRKGTLIDNIYLKSNHTQSQISSHILATCISDHLPCLLKLNLKQAKPKNPTSVTIRKACPDAHKKMIDYLNDELNDSHYVDDPEACYNNLEKTITKAIDKYMPLKTVKFNKYKHSIHDWICTGILRSVRTKDKLYRKILTTPSGKHREELKAKLTRYKKALKKLINSEKLKFYNGRFSTYKTDIKKTWAAINAILNKRNLKQTLPEYFDVNKKQISDTASLADHFNTFFTNIGADLADKLDCSGKRPMESYLTKKFNHSFEFKTIPEAKVIEYFQTLKSKTSFGHDNISSNLLKAICPAIYKPLTHCINRSILTGVFPTNLKLARVLPIYKNKGDPHLMTNYRPISLLPAASKIYEKALYEQIYDYFTEHKLMLDSQYGFRKKHSTEHAALELIDRLMEEIDKKNIPIAIFLDLSKAFDTLNHTILLRKLKYYGFKDSAISLMQSYLVNRKQYVEIDKIKSKTTTIITGVPQGSILGPLLFLICINDINQASKIFKFILYADDSTLKSIVNCSDPKSVSEIINKELEKIHDWLCVNKLSINAGKSKFMLFSTKQKNITEYKLNLKLKLCGEEIEQPDSFNFLGLTLDSNLSWNAHIKHIRVKLARTGGIIYRLKRFLPSHILKTLYCTLALPYLHYCSLAWGHASNKVSRSQKRIIRNIVGAKYNAHTEPICKEINILQASDIYYINSLIFYYKHHHNLLPPFLQSFELITGQNIHNYNTICSKSRVRAIATSSKFADNRMRVALINIANQVQNDPNIYGLMSFTLPYFKFFIKKLIITNYSYLCQNSNCFVCSEYYRPPNSPTQSQSLLQDLNLSP